MHYYKFNIADYRKDTAHLSLLEHGIYRQLVDSYYLDEKPIETQPVMRRLSIKTEEEKSALKNVLGDFFDESECGKFYTHKRIEVELCKYQENAETAKANGSKGGRPKKPKITQPVNSANPKETGSKANHKPITTNHKPITNTNNKPSAVDYSVFGMSDNQVMEVIRIRKQNKGGKITQRVANTLSKEFHDGCANGYTFDQLLDEWETRGWKSFKAEWMQSKSANGQRSDAAQRTVDNLMNVELN